MIYSVLSSKGGAGKSTLSICFAAELYKRGRKTLLVDADPQQSVMKISAFGTNKLEGPTFVAMTDGLERPSQLPLLAKTFDDVVIDTPGALDAFAKSIIKLSDVILIPTGSSPLDILETKDVVSIIATAKATVRPDLFAAIVHVNTHPRAGVCKRARKTLSRLALPLLSNETTHRVAWQETMATGRGVSLSWPKDKAASEMAALTDEILSHSAHHMQEAVNG